MGHQAARKIAVYCISLNGLPQSKRSCLFPLQRGGSFFTLLRRSNSRSTSHTMDINVRWSNFQRYLERSHCVILGECENDRPPRSPDPLAPTPLRPRPFHAKSPLAPLLLAVNPRRKTSYGAFAPCFWVASIRATSDHTPPNPETDPRTLRIN